MAEPIDLPRLLWQIDRFSYFASDFYTDGGSVAGHIVLDGDPAPKGAPTILDPCLLWPNGWMDQDVTWCGGRPQPRRHCVKGDMQRFFTKLMKK